MVSYKHTLYAAVGLSLGIGGYVGYKWYVNDQYQNESSIMFNQYLKGNHAYLEKIAARTDIYGQIARFIMLMRHMNGTAKLDPAQVSRIQDERHLYRSMKYILNIGYLLQNGATMDLGCLHKRNSHWSELAEYAKFLSTKQAGTDADLRQLGSRALHMSKAQQYDVQRVIDSTTCVFKPQS